MSSVQGFFASCLDCGVIENDPHVAYQHLLSCPIAERFRGGVGVRDQLDRAEEQNLRVRNILRQSFLQMRGRTNLLRAPGETGVQRIVEDHIGYINDNIARIITRLEERKQELDSNENQSGMVIGIHGMTSLCDEQGKYVVDQITHLKQKLDVRVLKEKKNTIKKQLKKIVELAKNQKESMEKEISKMCMRLGEFMISVIGSRRLNHRGRVIYSKSGEALEDYMACVKNTMQSLQTTLAEMAERTKIPAEKIARLSRRSWYLDSSSDDSDEDEPEDYSVGSMLGYLDSDDSENSLLSPESNAFIGDLSDDGDSDDGAASRKRATTDGDGDGEVRVDSIPEDPDKPTSSKRMRSL